MEIRKPPIRLAVVSPTGDETFGDEVKEIRDGNGITFKSVVKLHGPGTCVGMVMYVGARLYAARDFEEPVEYWIPEHTSLNLSWSVDILGKTVDAWRSAPIADPLPSTPESPYAD